MYKFMIKNSKAANLANLLAHYLWSWQI